MNDATQKLTYGETRTINIGDFESCQCFFSISSDVKSLNKKNTTISITASKSATASSLSNDIQNTGKLLQREVRKLLDTRDTQIRKWASNHVSFEAPEDKYPENRGC